MRYVHNNLSVFFNANSICHWDPSSLPVLLKIFLRYCCTVFTLLHFYFHSTWGRFSYTFEKFRLLLNNDRFIHQHFIYPTYIFKKIYSSPSTSPYPTHTRTCHFTSPILLTFQWMKPACH